MISDNFEAKSYESLRMKKECKNCGMGFSIRPGDYCSKECEILNQKRERPLEGKIDHV